MKQASHVIPPLYRHHLLPIHNMDKKLAQYRRRIAPHNVGNGLPLHLRLACSFCFLQSLEYNIARFDNRDVFTI